MAMALPLQNVLTLVNLEDQIFFCLAVSCPLLVDLGKFPEAAALSKDELIEHPKLMLELADTLLCDLHRQELGQEIVRGWIRPHPRGDLFHLFGIDIDCFEWRCIADGCVVDHLVFHDALKIINELAVDVICGEQEKRTDMVRDLVSRFHCEEHRVEIIMKPTWEEWGAKLAATFENEASSSGCSVFSSSETNENTGPRTSSSGTPGGRGENLTPLVQEDDTQHDDSEFHLPGAWRNKTPEPQQISTQASNEQRSESSSSDKSWLQHNVAEDAVPQDEAASPSRVLFVRRPTRQGRASSSGASFPAGTLSKTPEQKSKLRSASATLHRREEPSDSAQIASSGEEGRMPVLLNDHSRRRSNGSPRAMGKHAISKPRSSSLKTSHIQQKREVLTSQLRETQSSPALPLADHYQDTNKVSERQSPQLNRSISAWGSENNVFSAAAPSGITTQREIDDELLAIIRKPQGNQSTKKLGYVYVLQNPIWEGYVKIGRTNQRVLVRNRQIKRKCGIQELERVLDLESSRILNYELLEKLCHAELQIFQRKFRCFCGTQHRDTQLEHHEWFMIPKGVALDTVRKWRAWLRQFPYDENGNLKPWWCARVGIGPYKMGGPYHKDPHYLGTEMFENHESRKQRWTSWLRRPTRRDRVGFKIWTFFCQARDRRSSRWELAGNNFQRLVILFAVVFCLSGPITSTIIFLVFLCLF